MATFVMLTRLSHQALQNPSSLEALNEAVALRIRTDCPRVEWKASYVILGPTDYLDIFEAPDNDEALKVATIVRTFGHATTEVWGATEWERFVSMVRNLPMATVG